MTWFSKNVGDGVAAFGPTHRVTAAFVALAGDHSVSADAAIFSRYDVPTNVVTLYFSPTADIMATAFGATPCTKPNPDRDLALLVGDFNSWSIHFPGYDPGAFD
jgi:DhnA family fructose-bisphosphate aldolase class Ia